MIRRGDVVIVDFPFTDTGLSKVRPAVVVQNDRDNHDRAGQYPAHAGTSFSPVAPAAQRLPQGSPGNSVTRFRLYCRWKG
jgi:hypothetical protein